jgi:hypothetical protein
LPGQPLGDWTHLLSSALKRAINPAPPEKPQSRRQENSAGVGLIDQKLVGHEQRRPALAAPKLFISPFISITYDMHALLACAMLLMNRIPMKMNGLPKKIDDQDIQGDME